MEHSSLTDRFIPNCHGFELKSTQKQYRQLPHLVTNNFPKLEAILNGALSINCRVNNVRIKFFTASEV